MEQLKCVDPDTELWAALELMDRNGFNQMPVVKAQHVVGMLSREDVITFLRTLLEFGASPAQPLNATNDRSRSRSAVA
jgi:predicted transcriptional regulator